MIYRLPSGWSGPAPIRRSTPRPVDSRLVLAERPALRQAGVDDVPNGPQVVSLALSWLEHDYRVTLSTGERMPIGRALTTYPAVAEQLSEPHWLQAASALEASYRQARADGRLAAARENASKLRQELIREHDAEASSSWTQVGDEVMSSSARVVRLVAGAAGAAVEAAGWAAGWLAAGAAVVLWIARRRT